MIAAHQTILLYRNFSENLKNFAKYANHIFIFKIFIYIFSRHFMHENIFFKLEHMYFAIFFLMECSKFANFYGLKNYVVGLKITPS